MLHHRKRVQWDSVWVGGSVATFMDVPFDTKRVKNVVAVKGGNIAWVGLEEELEAPLADSANDEATLDLLTQRLHIHEKTAWMLRSQLEE